MNVPRDIKHEGWCTFPTLYQPITGKRVDSNGEVYNIADHYRRQEIEIIRLGHQLNCALNKMNEQAELTNKLLKRILSDG